MKLSDAIRDGAKIRPQKFGRMFGFTNTPGDLYGSCALGSAFEGCTGGTHTNEHEIEQYLRQRFPVLEKRVQNPKCGCCVRQVGDLIQVLNDKERWSREAIAEWVETIEKKLEAEAVTDGSSGIEAEAAANGPLHQSGDQRTRESSQLPASVS